MFRAAAGIKRAPLLGIECRRRPARRFKESHQFLARDFFTRHSARRPTIEQKRFDLMVWLSNFAAFDHFGFLSEGRSTNPWRLQHLPALVRGQLGNSAS